MGVALIDKSRNAEYSCRSPFDSGSRARAFSQQFFSCSEASSSARLHPAAVVAVLGSFVFFVRGRHLSHGCHVPLPHRHAIFMDGWVCCGGGGGGRVWRKREGEGVAAIPVEQSAASPFHSFNNVVCGSMSSS